MYFAQEKNKNDIIHEKLRVPPYKRGVNCIEKNYGNLRKPARQRRACAMQLFLQNKEYSTTIVSRFVCEKRSSNGSILSILGLPLPSRHQQTTL
jgi:hypothetical protein